MFGTNFIGQLGLSDIFNRLVPTKLEGYKANFVACGWHHTVFINNEDDIYVFGFNRNGQLCLGDTNNRLVPNKLEGYKAKMVACGGRYTVLLI